MTAVLTNLATRLTGLHGESGDLIVGLTGSVACGKTTLANMLAEALSPPLTSETVSTDGFLYPNVVLAEKDLTLRKGYPETFDREAMRAALEAIRAGEATFPVHSHETYDIDPALARTLARPDVLIFEGLGFHPPADGARAAHEPDVLIYLDAELEHIEGWYRERFVRFWKAAADDPTSFYAQFLHMSEPELLDFAMTVWDQINKPNLIDHILPLREVADIVVKKDVDHNLTLVADRL